MKSPPTHSVCLWPLWLFPYIISTRLCSNFCFNPIIQCALPQPWQWDPPPHQPCCLGMGKIPWENWDSLLQVLRRADLPGGIYPFFSRWGSPIYFWVAAMALFWLWKGDNSGSAAVGTDSNESGLFSALGHPWGLILKYSWSLNNARIRGADLPHGGKSLCNLWLLEKLNY